MCGITGWFSPTEVPERERLRLKVMVNALAHRGPDGQGSEIMGHAALGHTRLAIIDLQGGRQPMVDASGDVSIVFNGEIYNYQALSSDLRQRGRQFQTHSDTEVILQLYLEEGVQGFSRLRGMYAFVIWDAHRKSAFLVRDPLGIKPLFLCQHNERLFFASEVKALLAAGVVGKLDESALHLLLNFRYLPGDRSLFRGIRQLPPGFVLEWSQQRGIRRFRINSSARKAESGPILEAIRGSVRAHMTSDVQVGAYLSGGIDSATMVALAKETAQTQGDLPTFTLDVGDDPKEAAHAARTAQLLGVTNKCAIVATSPSEQLRNLIWQLELPKVNAWQVSELAQYAAHHVKVVISGVGGDELFYGYNMHRIMGWADTLSRRIPAVVHKPAGHLLAHMTRWFGVPWQEPERAALMFAQLGHWPRVYGLLRNVWDHPRIRRLIYGPRMLDQTLPDAFDELEQRWPDQRDPVRAAAQFEWREKMVNDLLWQEDRCSMAVGLEVRVPFVDSTLAERIQALSRQSLMPGFKLKGLLRAQLEALLPAEVLKRPKSGFQVDAAQFWRQLEPLAQTWLSEERINQYGLFNPEFVQQIRHRKPRKGLRWHFFMLYMMLATHLWLDLFEQP
jgi:asparagine synthase (glutamine-hydrolysing)